MLSRDLPGMSWREFSILLHGLSPFGAVATHYDEEIKKQRQEEKKADPNIGRREAAGFWSSITSFKPNTNK